MDAAQRIGLSLSAAALVMRRLKSLLERGEAKLDSSAVFTIVQHKT